MVGPDSGQWHGPGPDPSGPMPADWLGTAKTWDAYRDLAAGDSLRVVGVRHGVSRSTVSGWVTKWRARYGTELLRNRDSGNVTDAARALGMRAKQLKAAAGWVEVRTAAAARYGVLSDTALAAALLVIEDVFADPARRAALTMRDALILAQVADLAAGRADQLSDVADPNRVPTGPRTPGLFDGLDALPAGAAGGEVIEMIEVVTRGIRHTLEVEVE